MRFSTNLLKSHTKSSWCIVEHCNCFQYARLVKNFSQLAEEKKAYRYFAYIYVHREWICRQLLSAADSPPLLD